MAIISRMTIESELGPTVHVEDPLGANQTEPGLGSRVMSFIKPRITLETALGPTVMAPWGEPGPTKWPKVQVGLAVGTLVVAWLATRAVLCRCS